MADIGKITVSIEHRQDKLDKGLDQAERRVRTSVDKMNKDTEKGIGGGFVNAFAKGLAALGGFEAGLKGVTALIQGLNGDSEALEQTVRSLPLGLGAAVGAAIDLTRAITGSAEQAERINRSNESLLNQQKALVSIERELMQIRATSSESQAALIGMDSESRIRELLRQQASANIAFNEATLKSDTESQRALLGQIRAIDRQIKAERELAAEKRRRMRIEEGLKKLSEDQAQAARRAAASDALADMSIDDDTERQVAQQRRRIARLTDEFSSGGFMDPQQAEAIREEIRLAEARIAQIRESAATASAKALADIEAENRRMTLEAEGKTFEARRRQAMDFYDKRIMDAKDAATRQALAEQRALRVREIDRAEMEQRERDERAKPGAVDARLGDFFDFENNPFDAFFADLSKRLSGGSTQQVALARSAVNVGQSGDGIERQQLTELQQLVAQARQQKTALDGIKSNLEFQ